MSAAAATRPRVLFRAIIAVVGVILLAWALVAVPVRQDLRWVDARSGTEKRQSVWLFFVRTGLKVEQSAVDRRLRAMGAAWEPDWCFLNDTSRNAIGRPIRFACGVPSPRIYDMHMLQQAFCDVATDDEVRTLHRTMSDGTDDQRKAAVDAVMSKVFNYLVDRNAADEEE